MDTGIACKTILFIQAFPGGRQKCVPYWPASVYSQLFILFQDPHFYKWGFLLFTSGGVESPPEAPMFSVS
jgi:hypothetical protein